MTGNKSKSSTMQPLQRRRHHDEIHIYDKEIAALLVIDPYNDFISEAGKIWDCIRAAAEAKDCFPHVLHVLNAARKATLRVFYSLHHRYRPDDYETWKYIAPVQKAAWVRKSFESRRPNLRS